MQNILSYVLIMLFNYASSSCASNSKSQLNDYEPGLSKDFLEKSIYNFFKKDLNGKKVLTAAEKQFPQMTTLNKSKKVQILIDEITKQILNNPYSDSIYKKAFIERKYEILELIYNEYVTIKTSIYRKFEEYKIKLDFADDITLSRKCLATFKLFFPFDDKNKIDIFILYKQFDEHDYQMFIKALDIKYVCFYFLEHMNSNTLRFLRLISNQDFKMAFFKVSIEYGYTIVFENILKVIEKAESMYNFIMSLFPQSLENSNDNSVLLSTLTNPNNYELQKLKRLLDELDFNEKNLELKNIIALFGKSSYSVKEQIYGYIKEFKCVRDFRNDLKNLFDIHKINNFHNNYDQRNEVISSFIFEQDLDIRGSFYNFLLLCIDLVKIQYLCDLLNSNTIIFPTNTIQYFTLYFNFLKFYYDEMFNMNLPIPKNELISIESIIVYVNQLCNFFNRLKKVLLVSNDEVSVKNEIK